MAVFAFAAGALLASSMSFASPTATVNDFLRTGETAIDDVVKGVESDDVLGDRSMMLAVNGRIVASDEGRASVAPNKWNWTLLLLGSAGLVISQLARRRSRRTMISYYHTDPLNPLI